MQTFKYDLKRVVQNISDQESKRLESVKQFETILRQYKDASNLFLSREDINKLESKDIRKYQLFAVKNMLVFSYYSGLKLDEILKLKKSNIKVLQDGSNALEIKRSDGMPHSLIPINRRMSSIIHFYNGYHKNARKGKLFPTYSNDSINESLLFLSAFFRIYKPLSFLMARRSYVVNEILKGTKEDTLQTYLGHKELKSTRRYMMLLMQEKFRQKIPFTITTTTTNGK